MKQAALCILALFLSGCVIQNWDYSPPVDGPVAQIRIQTSIHRGWVRFYTFDLADNCEGRREISLFLADTDPLTTSVAAGGENAIMMKFLHTAYPVEITSQAILKFSPTAGSNYVLDVQTLGTNVGWDLLEVGANGEAKAVANSSYKVTMSWNEGGSFCAGNNILVE